MATSTFRPNRCQLCCTALLFLCAFTLLSCGASSPNCDLITFTLTPVTATLDHTVAGNSQQYTAGVSVPPGCHPPPVPGPVFSISNTTDASITPSGIASCKKASSAPITVSAGQTYPTATLICN